MRRVAVLLLGSVPIVARAFPTSPFVAKPASKLVVILVLLRLSADVIVAIASTFLLLERDRFWVERLRLARSVLVLEGVALVLDILYFPSAIVRNLFA
jgi:hypothetical protein